MVLGSLGERKGVTLYPQVFHLKEPHSLEPVGHSSPEPPSGSKARAVLQVLLL